MTAPCKQTTARKDDDRDCASELRAWLMTYSRMNVSRRDAENLIDFLKKTGWKQP